MMLWVRINRSFLSKYEYFVLVILIVFTIVVNVIWLMNDNKPPAKRDTVNLYSISIRISEELKSPKPDLDNIFRILGSFGGRPPLYPILAIPFIAFFGRSVDSATYVNFLFYPLLIIATYYVGKEVSSKRAGILSAILIAFYPPIVKLSRHFMTYFSLPAASALTIWLLLRFIKSRSIKDIWLVNLSLAFGFLLHPSFLYGVSIPTASALLGLIFFETSGRVSQLSQFPSWVIGKFRQELFLKGLLPSAVLSIGLILMWYVPFGSGLVLILSGLQEQAALSSSGKILVPPLNLVDDNYIFFWYALSFGKAISSTLALLFWIGFLTAFIKRSPLVLGLAIMFVVSYSIFSAQVTYSWMHFSQLLPVVAVLTAAWVDDIRSKLISSALVMVCLGSSLFNYATVTGNLDGHSLRLEYPEYTDDRFSPYALFYPDPPLSGDWHIQDIFKTVDDDPMCAPRDCTLYVITESVYINYGLMIYDITNNTKHNLVWSALGRYPNFLAFLESEYILYHDSELTYGVDDNGVDDNKGMLQFMQTPSPLFSDSHQVVAEFKTPHRGTVMLYKRVKPLSWKEAEEVIQAFQLPESMKVTKYEVFAHLAAKEGETEKLLALYAEAIQEIAQLDTQSQVELMTRLGDIYSKSQKLDLAAEIYLQILNLTPNRPYNIHFRLARIYQRLGDCAKMRFHFGELARLNPSAVSETFLVNTYQKCIRNQKVTPSTP